MVSPAVYAYLLNGVYYHFGIDWYGCPENLGAKIIQNLRDYTSKDFQLLAYYLSRIEEKDCGKYVKEVIEFSSLLKSAQTPKTYGFIRTYSRAPYINLFIRNIYIIDLDRHIFSMICSHSQTDKLLDARFAFGSIPKEWLKILYESEDSESEFENSDSSDSDSIPSA